MMKTLFKALAFALILCFASCSTDDDGYVELYSLRIEPKNSVVEVGKTIQPEKKRS
ncbi:MAG: hypothetical protein J6K33_07375 [Alistipes sp.]|nr:hypothetical protein [Alistipes sp.]